MDNVKIRLKKGVKMYYMRKGWAENPVWASIGVQKKRKYHNLLTTHIKKV